MAFFGDIKMASESALKKPSKGNKIGPNEEFLSFCLPVNFKLFLLKLKQSLRLDFALS